MQLNHTILEAINGVQIQGHVPPPPRYQWDAVPNEGVHAIETLWCRAGGQPFEIAVGTRDIAIRAGRDVDDDFATLRHESDLRCQEPRSGRYAQPSPGAASRAC